MTTTHTEPVEIADKVIDAITDFTTRVTIDDLSPSALQAARRCLVDAVGCAVGAQRTTVIAKLRRLAATATSTRPASLIGGGPATSPEMAAFVNGSAIRCLDFNDDYFGTEHTNAHGDTGPTRATTWAASWPRRRSPVPAAPRRSWGSPSPMRSAARWWTRSS